MLIHLVRCLLSFSNTLIHVGWSHLLSISNCLHGIHKANGLFEVILSGLLLPHSKMTPNTWFPPFQQSDRHKEGPARNILMLYCANWDHSSLSLGKEGLLSPPPPSVHTLLSRALSLWSLRQCHGLPPPWSSANLILVFFGRWLKSQRMERGGPGLKSSCKPGWADSSVRLHNSKGCFSTKYKQICGSSWRVSRKFWG